MQSSEGQGTIQAELGELSCPPHPLASAHLQHKEPAGALLLPDCPSTRLQWGGAQLEDKAPKC